MDRAKIKRELLAVLMESPYYFNIPLRRRLAFIIFFSQQSVYNLLREHNKQLNLENLIENDK